MKIKTKKFLVKNQDNFIYILMVLIGLSFLTILYLVNWKNIFNFVLWLTGGRD